MHLLARARAGDDAAFAAIERRFVRMLRFKARRMFAPGLDDDDLMQEARVGLMKAVRDYRDDGGAAFASFAALCVDRQLATAVKTARRGKHGPLNDSVGFTWEGEANDLEWEPAAVGADPADRYEVKELGLEMLRFLRHDLSGLEGKAVWLIEAEGLSYDAAAAELGVSVKTLDNAVQRARRKLEREFGPQSCDVCLRPVEVGDRRCSPCVEEIAFARELIAA